MDFFSYWHINFTIKEGQVVRTAKQKILPVFIKPDFLSSCHGKRQPSPLKMPPPKSNIIFLCSLP